MIDIIMIIIVIVITIFFAVAVCRFSAKLEIQSREDAPNDIRVATEQEKDFFRKYYQLTGRSIYSKKHIDEVEKMCQGLKVAKGYIAVRHESCTEDVSAYFDIIINNKKYLNKHLTVGNGKPYDYADSIWENTPIIGFFAPDENGMYKSIAFATVENVENKSKEIPF